jgi:hypothetical protein
LGEGPGGNTLKKELCRSVAPQAAGQAVLGTVHCAQAHPGVILATHLPGMQARQVAS